MVRFSRFMSCRPCGTVYIGDTHHFGVPFCVTAVVRLGRSPIPAVQRALLSHLLVPLCLEFYWWVKITSDPISFFQYTRGCAVVAGPLKEAHFRCQVSFKPVVQPPFTLVLKTIHQTNKTNKAPTQPQPNMNPSPSTSTSSLLSVFQRKSSPKNWESAFGQLSSSYGFGGTVPSLPPKSSKPSKSLPKSTTSPVPPPRPQPAKDYEAAFGQLSSSYGFGGSAPHLSSKK